jgi:CheY-like chemotaxis protein
LRKLIRGNDLAAGGTVRRKAAMMSELQTSDGSVVSGMTEAVSRFSAGHVLIADGNAESRDRREVQLRDAGFRVSVARTGFEAIVKASYHVPDLILIDDSLADIEASETGRLLTTCPMTAHIPVIRLSAGRRVPQRVFSAMRRTG